MPSAETPVDVEFEPFSSHLVQLSREVTGAARQCEVGTCPDTAKLSAFSQRFRQLEPYYAHTREKVAMPSSSLRSEVRLLRIEIVRKDIQDQLRWMKDEKPAVGNAPFAGSSPGDQHFRELLEGLLVDPEFCGSVKHCGKVAKGAPPLRPNLEYLFQTVEAHKVRQPTSNTPPSGP